LLSLLLPTRAAAAAPNPALKLDVPLFREDIVIGVVRIG